MQYCQRRCADSSGRQRPDRSETEGKVWRGIVVDVVVRAKEAESTVMTIAATSAAVRAAWPVRGVSECPRQAGGSQLTRNTTKHMTRNTNESFRSCESTRSRFLFAVIQSERPTKLSQAAMAFTSVLPAPFFPHYRLQSKRPNGNTLP